MNFIKEVPTKPGFYAWRSAIGDVILPYDVVTIGQREDGTFIVFMTGQYYHVDIKAMGGEWCRLVPAEEVKEAWEESREDDDYGRFPKWENSRAKRVMEGHEPS